MAMGGAMLGSVKRIAPVIRGIGILLAGRDYSDLYAKYHSQTYALTLLVIVTHLGSEMKPMPVTRWYTCIPDIPLATWSSSQGSRNTEKLWHGELR